MKDKKKEELAPVGVEVKEISLSDIPVFVADEKPKCEDDDLDNDLFDEG